MFLYSNVLQRNRRIDIEFISASGISMYLSERKKDYIRIEERLLIKGDRYIQGQSYGRQHHVENRYKIII